MNKYNLTDILSKDLIIEEQDAPRLYKFEGIQIPMIQRDYAQGRVDEVDIRNRFLKSIFDALVKDENLELDFVYGSIKELDKKLHFIPLDGQQRITTLFLLHWYISNRELTGPELELLLTTLKGFTYATRSSARDFCEKLVQITINFKENPSKEITDSAWFYGRFEKDPTVKAMLIMLDAIHLKYEEIYSKNNEIRLFKSLAKLSFYVLPLDGFDLSDELYIKMNARGKQLTGFENFKADLTNWLLDETNPFFTDFQKIIEVNGRVMPYNLSISLKFDNDWTNLFWKFTKLNIDPVDKVVDPYFVRFWNRYLLNLFIIQNESTIESIEKEYLYQLFSKDEDFFKYDKFDEYQKLFEIKGVIQNAQVVLDNLVKHYDEICSLLMPAWNGNDSWTLFNNSINQRQRILFLAVTLYLEKNEFNKEQFKNWIRVVWNIIIDPDNRSTPAMVSVMRIINKISPGSNDIYSFLADKGALEIIQSEKSFAKAQLQEERTKAILILSEAKWEDDLIEVEAHPLFAGNIGFLLSDQPDKITFNKRKIIATQIFSKDGANDIFRMEHILMRAIIGKIVSWDILYKLNFGDNVDNWQLMLRRNSTVQLIIRDFSDFTDIKTALKEITRLSNTNSQIGGWEKDKAVENKAMHIHEAIYMDASFHEWIQASKAVNLISANNHIYVHRPRSRYDWVALDTYRNEIITAIINRFHIYPLKECENTNYYWGATISLSKSFEKIIVSLVFDTDNKLRIGIKEDGKSEISQNISWPQTDIEQDWIVRKVYSYGGITSDIEIITLVDKINAEIFDESNSSSLVYKLSR